MPITIENPTAEAVWKAVQQLPQDELARLRELLAVTPSENGDDYFNDPTYSSEWSEEDLADARRATGQLIEKRFGPEAGDYD